ncbi:ArsR/SmtB family transcription factor [Actinokineospora sp.]|uniref:ArsR/SmtB family transcription factor n=1 Tax=Actinokineospora sp. TaxID=1872133 RepID=UPI00403840B7
MQSLPSVHGGASTSLGGEGAMNDVVRCAGDLGAPIALPDAEVIAAIFQALSSPTRVRLIALLRDAPRGASRVGDLVDRIGLTQSTVSHHLRALAAAGLIVREQRGSWAWYSVATDRLDALAPLFGQLMAIGR